MSSTMLVDYELMGLQTAKYLSVSAMAILLIDYFITFQAEIYWVWGRKWNTTRVIFTISRYLPFVGTAMTMYAAVVNRNGQNCAVFGNASNALHIIGILAAEGLLIIRTYAFWRCSKKLLSVLLFLAVVCLVGAVTSSHFIIIELPSDSTEANIFDDPGSPCIFQVGRSSSLQYVALMIYEIVILGLTAYRRWHSHSHFKDSVLATLYRDSMVYIVCIIFISGVAIIIAFTLPISFNAMLDSPQIVIHSVLASRILFNLREADKHEHEGTLVVDMSDFQAGSWSYED
ncbi:hypothetical protein BV22DRAFT_1198510 [Leucogyrophana mollusca]|uniref:Uncharacterized protein n=1 Tax=Leucogyrophana mollusca TaxID=85980 RepID=A0ACB8B679_9AGAM|nr:hypothetical protein BV22DRAFT_1198510 [Leucogyrophana mollusca]